MAKKKESKIADLSRFTENEKIALLELYKAAYEKLQLEEKSKEDESLSINHSDDTFEQDIEFIDSDELCDDEVMNNNETIVTNNLKDENEAVVTENVNVQTETVITESGLNEAEKVALKAVKEETIATKEDTLKDVQGLGIIHDDESTYMDDILGISNDEITNYGTSTSSEYVLENGEKGNRSDAFEYTSFTPYKPKYDDIELTNDFFTMSNNMGMQVDVSKSTNTGKYNLKTKNIKTNMKVSRNGAYTIQDTYSAQKDKIEIPYLKVITVLISLIGLVCYVIQFVSNFEQAKILNYFCDLCFALSLLFAFISAISSANVVNSLKGVTLFGAFTLHFICFGIEGYQEGLFRVLNQTNNYDLIYGVATIAFLVSLYVFIFAVAIRSLITKGSSAKIINIIAGVLIIASVVMLIYSNIAGERIMFCDVLPEYLAFVIFGLSIALSCNIKHKRR